MKKKKTGAGRKRWRTRCRCTKENAQTRTALQFVAVQEGATLQGGDGTVRE